MRRLFVALGAALPVAVAMSYAPAAQSADAVCFASSQFGISCVTPDGIKSFARGQGLPTSFVSHMVPCGDKIAVAAGNRIVLFDGEKFDAPINVSTGASKIACDGKGGIWAAGHRGVSFWDGSGWKSWEKETVAPGEKNAFVGALAAGPDGTVWAVVSGRALAHYDGKAWKLFKEGDGLDQRYYLSQIAVVDGAPLVPHSRGVLTFKDGKWSNTPGPRGNRIHVGRNGTIWITGSRTIVEMKDGKFREIEVPGYAIYEATSDADGRLWVATNFGMGVLSDGKWNFRQMHNSGSISNQYNYIAALGKGAALPAEVEQKDGSLKGRLEWTSGDPGANVEVVICGVGKFLFRGGSPCDGQPLAHSTKTDGDGKFAFDTVKPAAYNFYIKGKQNRWYGIIGVSRNTRVEPGQAKNTGTIKMSDRIKPD